MSNRPVVYFGLSFLLVAAFVPISFASDLGAEWGSVKSYLSDGEKSTTLDESLSKVNEAHQVYINSFKAAAIQVDPESDTIIENAFEQIVSDYKNEIYDINSLNRQVIDKTIYKIAYMKMELAVEQDNAKDFVDWYSVLNKKFKVSEKDYGSNQWVAEINSNSQALASNGPLILDELLNIFKLKTFEELEEAIAALEKEDVKSAKKFAYEGLYYYRTLHPSIETVLGTESSDMLLENMQKAIDVSMSDSTPMEMKSSIEEIASDVELILREYEGGDTSSLGLALSGIKDRLHLVEIEYLDAVANGKIINQVEYDETVVFLNKATSILNSVETELLALSKEDTESLSNNLSEMDSIITSVGEPSKVQILVGKSLNNVASLQALSGGAQEIDIFQYFDEIDRLLNEAKVSYRSGDSQAAFDLVSKAYLDNYEFVEGPLGEVDHDLMTKIEIDMRVDLRNMIKTNASPDKVDAQIDMILLDLGEARKVVPEFGAVAMLILAVSVIAIVLFTSKSRFNMFQKF